MDRPPDKERTVHDDAKISEAPSDDRMALRISRVDHDEVLVSVVIRQRVEPAANDIIIQGKKLFRTWPRRRDQLIVDFDGLEMIVRLRADI